MSDLNSKIVSSITENFDTKNHNYTHGGQLNNAANKYNIPLIDWIDLSTGINQNSYPIPIIPETVWNRLPENDDGLNEIAAHYYQCNSLLAVAGSQVAIQIIPTLFSNVTVGIVQPGFYEHEKHWLKHNHTVVTFQHTPTKNDNNEHELISKINKKINSLNTLVIINPNNPSGYCFTRKQLLQWQEILAKKNGYLIVDEAFMDANDENSLLHSTLPSNIIILRSIGKFFGLAGIRLGFVFSNNSILNEISHLQGPWPISGPSRWIASKALADIVWQKQTRSLLRKSNIRLKSLLIQFNLSPSGSTDLFQWIETSHAKNIHHQLNQHGILTRLFDRPLSLRFGLPKNETQWQRLELALHTCTKQLNTVSK